MSTCNRLDTGISTESCPKISPIIGPHTHIFFPGAVPGGKFLGRVGQDPSASKSNQLHVDIFRFGFHSLEVYSSIDSSEIIGNPPEVSTPTGYFLNSIGSSVTNRRLSLSSAPVSLIRSLFQCGLIFFGIIGQNPSVCKSSWLHSVIFWVFFIHSRHILP